MAESFIFKQADKTNPIKPLNELPHCKRTGYLGGISFLFATRGGELTPEEIRRN